MGHVKPQQPPEVRRWQSPCGHHFSGLRLPPLTLDHQVLVTTGAAPQAPRRSSGDASNDERRRQGMPSPGSLGAAVGHHGCMKPCGPWRPDTTADHAAAILVAFGCLPSLRAASFLLLLAFQSPRSALLHPSQVPKQPTGRGYPEVPLLLSTSCGAAVLQKFTDTRLPSWPCPDSPL
ncbi:hypothetical protein NDU88_002833 [Pleurodeles waltl]|uniref:Uncharacterized protein n=1 Tax=Pleurodeles waltl TaxID=8319 RepID=A0AAV7MQ17_PLEWA|nr:hypothetical protein NDU88_002833 [Pleurodeles waltl]